MKKLNLLLISILLIWTINLNGQDKVNLNDIVHYRNFAPHRVGSWISSICVPDTEDENYRNTYYVAGRGGGVWKTTNNGTTFFPIFDSVEMSSIGDIAVSSSSPEQVWVGTGEAFNTRSTHAGNGVYFSPDGGKSWQFKGLENSHHISKVIVHPQNPKVVFVAAMGRLFTPNKERGVFKTSDGGKSWEKVLFVDENTGVIDMVINPSNPDILYAATYEKYRYPWHYEAGGIHSGIYQTKDGGKSWVRLSAGLPSGKLGRIGLALCYNQPEIVYTVIENLNPRPGVKINQDTQMNHLRDPYFDQMIGGEVYRSNNNGESWQKMNEDECNVSAKAAYSFNKILVSPDNPNRIIVSSDALINSLDGGKTWFDCDWEKRTLFVNMFGDIRSFWVNPRDGNHMMIGSDGGLYVTWDGGKTVDHKYQIPLGEVYTVETDNADPYHIYVGLQDHEAWKAPVNGWSGRISSGDWNIIGMWDGMYTKVNPENTRWAYITTQFGSHHRIDQLDETRVNIQPQRKEGEESYRFCWTTPLELSPHNPDILYTGGEVLLRSLDRGDYWEEISPDLTTNQPEKIAGKGHMMYCTITSISESKLTPGLIWVGTDDGKVHITRNHGKTWTEVTQNIAKVAEKTDMWVSRVLSSQHDEGTAYVCKSGFRYDDFTPLVFKTTDYGNTWKKITAGLPDAPVNVIVEDHKRSELLFLGNDKGVFVSHNGGEIWESFRLNMPVVPVKDIKIHPRENDLVVGTFGRGAYVVDISLLQQLNEEILNKEVHLFEIEPKPVRNYSEQAYWGSYHLLGDNHLYTPNEPNGIIIYYYINEKLKAKSKIKLEVYDLNNNMVKELDINKKTGMHITRWETYGIKPGIYVVRMQVNKDIYEQKAVVKQAPLWQIGNKYIR